MPLALRKAGAAAEGAFPEAAPESVGIPARALELLAGRLQALVDDGEIVGGELLVIKNRKSVLREAFGWKDRDDEEPLEVDSIYCVRSMTKPFVGTAIQMLIDEGRLRLDTPVHEILPFFAGPQTGKITLEHLLTHTAGFPFTTIGKPLADYADLAEVAAEAAATELLFEPGARFEYSDAGSDTLGAIVAKITGAPVERFLQERILDPLEMRETITLLGDDDVLARIPSAYSGGTGAWSKHWDPSDPPIFPLFLTSQSLYSTTTDYARFLGAVDGRWADRRKAPAVSRGRGARPVAGPGDALPERLRGAGRILRTAVAGLRESGRRQRSGASRLRPWRLRRHPRLGLAGAGSDGAVLHPVAWHAGRRGPGRRAADAARRTSAR